MLDESDLWSVQFSFFWVWRLELQMNWHLFSSATRRRSSIYPRRYFLQMFTLENCEDNVHLLVQTMPLSKHQIQNTKIYSFSEFLHPVSVQPEVSFSFVRCRHRSVVLPKDGVSDLRAKKNGGRAWLKVSKETAVRSARTSISTARPVSRMAQWACIKHTFLKKLLLKTRGSKKPQTFSM